MKWIKIDKNGLKYESSNGLNLNREGGGIRTKKVLYSKRERIMGHARKRLKRKGVKFQSLQKEDFKRERERE